VTPRLFAIVPPAGAVDPAIVEEWLAAGVDAESLALVLREPGSVPGGLLDPNGRLAPIRARARAREIAVVLGCAAIDLDAAAAAVREHGLAGVQLRGDPSREVLARARERLGSAFLARSCHGAPHGGHALVDATVVAPVLATASHPRAPTLGMAGLAAWCAEPGARIVALGGLGAAHAPACARAGAWGLAGISAFFGPDRARCVAAFAAALTRR
jgi:8-oxo-dGTP diphosphatase